MQSQEAQQVEMIDCIRFVKGQELVVGSDDE
jgi:hypothetical protein